MQTIAKIVAYDDKGNEIAMVVPCPLPGPGDTDHRFDGHFNHAEAIELSGSTIIEAFVELMQEG